MFDLNDIRKNIREYAVKKERQDDRLSQVQATLLRRILDGKTLVKPDGVNDPETRLDDSGSGISIPSAINRVGTLLANAVPITTPWHAVREIVRDSVAQLAPSPEGQTWLVRMEMAYKVGLAERTRAKAKAIHEGEQQRDKIRQAFTSTESSETKTHDDDLQTAIDFYRKLNATQRMLTIEDSQSEDVKQKIVRLRNKNKLPDSLTDFYFLLRHAAEDIRLARLLTDDAKLDHGFALARWAEAGLPVFDLTHSLTSTLILTDPPPPPAEYEAPDPDFKFPFSSFVVRIPAGFLNLPDSTTESVRAVRMHLFEYEATWARLTLLDPSSKRNLRLSLWSMRNFEAKNRTKKKDDGDRFLAMLYRLLLNLAAWTSVYGAGVLAKPPHPRSGRVPGVSAPTVWITGQEVKLSPELRRLAVEYAAGNEKATPGWKLRMRFCVRGHWKMQPCGPGGTERKRIFVEPYWKGPEGAAAWQHVYKAGEENH